MGSKIEPTPTESRRGSSAIEAVSGSNYTVVARRYRPQRFEDVVGQDHVVQALRNAIRLNRLAQAYLFCGTRGVGKTSIARIFAKCLNCVQGPTETPCQVCDICQSIASGQDVDVIEIDGASNNGVEQVRELRQNASLRPSRSRFKIYYIDEVHMLSTGAFNALLKTLEEPPPHVKFFFATTEANKIPITVLSRCQRYDFAGITPDAIVETLKEICEREQVPAETEALQVVARRANGSMRDAQSLLERLLSSGSPELTVEVVNRLLGTPSDERLFGMLDALASGDSGAALGLLDEAITRGVQPSDFLMGILDFLRDAMVLSVGAGSIVLSVTPRQKPRLQAVVDRWSPDAILSALQILAQARAMMRGVAHGRLLVELALVRVCRLENLTDLGELVERLSSAHLELPSLPKGAASGVKKKLTEDTEPASALKSEFAVPRPVFSSPPAPEPAKSGESGGRSVASQPVRREEAPRSSSPVPEPSSSAEVSEGPAAASSHPPIDLDAVRKVWPDLVGKVGPALGMKVISTEPIAVEGLDLVVFAAKPGYNSLADACETREALEKIGQGMQRLLRRPVRVIYKRTAAVEMPQGPGRGHEGRPPDVLASDPMVQKIVELFEARPFRLEYDEEPDTA